MHSSGVRPSVCPVFLTLLGRAANIQRDLPDDSTRLGRRNDVYVRPSITTTNILVYDAFIAYGIIYDVQSLNVTKVFKQSNQCTNMELIRAILVQEFFLVFLQFNKEIFYFHFIHFTRRFSFSSSSKFVTSLTKSLAAVPISSRAASLEEVLT